MSMFSRATYAATVSSCLIVVRCRRICLLPVNRSSVASVVYLLPLSTPSVYAKVYGESTTLVLGL